MTKKLIKPRRVVAKKRIIKARVPAEPVFGKYIHPYGTARHADLAWHVARLERVLSTLEADGAQSVQRALAFAQGRHEGQMRKGVSGSAYIIHPVRMMNILFFEWSIKDPVMLSAALLHDVVEDTQTTLKEVKDAFGNEIGKLVDGMTMWKGSETYETYVKRVARGPEHLRLLKCADTLDNLRSWYETMDRDEFARWWRNVNELIIPMARSMDDNGVAATAIRRVLEDPWYVKKAGMEE